MRRSSKAKAAILTAASTAALMLAAAGSAQAQSVLVSQYSGDNFTSGNWNNDVAGAPVGTSKGSNTFVANAFGTHAGVNVSAGGFTVPTSSSTPPGGLTSFTVAAVFDPTANVVTGNAGWQAQSIYGYDINGAGTPDMALGFGAQSGQSFVAGLGTNGAGDATIDSGAVNLNTAYSVVYQVEDPGGAAGQGTMTMWVNGALVEQLTGLTVAPMNPPAAGGNFGLGGNFGQVPTKGLIGLVQVYDDTNGVENGQQLSQSLAQNYGGTNELYTWNAGTGAFSTGSNYVGGSAPDTSGTAEVLISNGGTAQVLSTDNLNIGSLVLGNGAGTSGNLTQVGGTFNVGSSVNVGYGEGTGTLSLSGGALNLNNSGGGIYLAGTAAAPSAMYVSGTAVINNVGGLYVGNTNNDGSAGNASVNMSGGTLIVNGPGAVGNGTGSVGNFYLSGGTFNVSGNQMNVGNAGGTGNVTMTGGTLTTNQTICLGEGYGATGTMVMSGGNLNMTGQLWIADANGANNGTGGTGSFTLNGGTVTTNNWTVVGRGGSTTGVLTINGGTFIHNGGGAGNFEIGSYGDNNGTPNNATLNLNGGTLITNFIQDESPNPTGNTIPQTINFNGGVLEPNDNDGGFIGGHQSNGDVFVLNVQGGGLIFNANGPGAPANGYSDGITEPLLGSPGDGGVTVNGPGELALTASNTFNGPTTVNHGELQITQDAALGNSQTITLNNGQIINDGSTFTLNASRSIVIVGTGYLDPGWSGWTNDATISGGNLGITFDSGILAMASANTYTGSTTIGSLGVAGNNGTNGSYYDGGLDGVPYEGLQLDNAGALPVGTGVTFGVDPNNVAGSLHPTLDLNGYSPTIGTLNGTGAGAQIINSNAGSESVLTLGSATGNSAGITSTTVSSYAGSILDVASNSSYGTIAVTKIGPGIQVLSGTLDYSGPTTLSAGKLYINGTSSNSAFSVATGTTLGGSGTINSALSIPSGAFLEGGYQGVGTLNATAGVSLASGSNIVIGNLTNYQNSAGIPAINVSGGALALSGPVGVVVTGATGSVAVGNVYDLLNYPAGMETGTGPFQISGSLPDRASGTISDTGAEIELTITATDFLVWTGVDGSSWDTITPNFKLNSSGGAVTYINNPGDTVLFNDTASTYTVNLGAAQLTPSAVTFNNSANAYTLTGTGGISGLTGLTKLGTNVVTLDTANTYTGATQVENGTLQIGTGGTIASASPVVLGSGTTSGVLELGDSTGPVSLTLSSLTTSGTGTTNSVVGGNATASTLTMNVTSGSNTYSGLVGSGTAGATTANALALVKSGSGTFTLTGSNSYTGGTTISGGTLGVGNNNALGGAGGGAVTVTGNSTLQAASSSVTLPNNFSLGTAAFVVNTPGTDVLTLNGSISNTLGTDVGVLQPTGTGTLVLAGALNIAGGNNDTNNQAIQLQSTGNTTTITGTGTLSGISMGWLGTSNTLNLAPAGTLNFTNNNTALDVGQQGGNGWINQTAGTVNMSSGNISLGKWDSSYGGYAISAGTLNVENFFSGGNGNGNGNSYFLQTGGTVNVGNYTTLGQGGAGNNTLYIAAGTYNNTGNFITVTNSGGSNASVTVGAGGSNNSTAVLNSGGIVMGGGNSASSTAILNLNAGGTISTTGISDRYAVADSVVNFNGGSLVAAASNTAFLSGVTTANIFSGGANINTAGFNVLVSQNLLSAGGTGGLLTPATIGSGGTGYIGAPVIEVTGGGGTGATAVATISGGAITGITITNPGTGYTSQPTFTPFGGGGTGAAINAPNPTNNAADGGLIKTGAGTLTLTGSNTYTGNTQVKAGTVAVGNNSALGTGSAILSNATTLQLNYVPSAANLVNFSSSGPTPFAINTNGFTPVVSSNGTSVQMTSQANSEATSVFSQNFYSFDDSTGFIASFTYTHATAGAFNTVADGVMFVVQSSTPNALGLPGGDLGYANSATAAGITNSVAAGLEIYNDALETGENGFLTNVQANDTTPFLSESTSDTITVVYNGPAETLTETVVSNFNGATATIVTTGVDLANDLSGSPGGTGYGFIGFTGATGGLNDSQSVSNLQFNNNGTTLPNNPNSLAISNQIVVLPAAMSTIQLGSAGAGPTFSSGSVGPISIGAGGTLVVAGVTTGATHGVLTTPSVTLSNSSSGSLDIQNNALDITGQTLASVNAMVASAYNNGKWTGPGITSSTAAGNTTHLTAVGVISNSPNGTPLFTGSNTFDGVTPGANDVLVKYTYYGDANLSGNVDASDYSLIDNGYLHHLTGWYNGDFNYDGVINGSDYTLIDNAYNMQGASLADELVNPSVQATDQISNPSSVVPEPASLGLLSIGVVGLLSRRRRR